jgi:hypothetical protein
MTETRTAANDLTWVPCTRCSGTGAHGPVSVVGGKCFACTDASGIPAGGHWVPVAVVKRRESAAKRREAKRKAGAAARNAAFGDRNETAIAALEAAGFVNVRTLKASAVATDAYPAWAAIIAVRDQAADPAKAYADWLNR